MLMYTLSMLVSTHSCTCAPHVQNLVCTFENMFGNSASFIFKRLRTCEQCLLHIKCICANTAFWGSWGVIAQTISNPQSTHASTRKRTRLHRARTHRNQPAWGKNTSGTQFKHMGKSGWSPGINGKPCLMHNTNSLLHTWLAHLHDFVYTIAHLVCTFANFCEHNCIVAIVLT